MGRDLFLFSHHLVSLDALLSGNAHLVIVMVWWQDGGSAVDHWYVAGTQLTPETRSWYGLLSPRARLFFISSYIQFHSGVEYAEEGRICPDQAQDDP